MRGTSRGASGCVLLFGLALLAGTVAGLSRAQDDAVLLVALFGFLGAALAFFGFRGLLGAGRKTPGPRLPNLPRIPAEPRDGGFVVTDESGVAMRGGGMRAMATLWNVLLWGGAAVLLSRAPAGDWSVPVELWIVAAISVGWLALAWRPSRLGRAELWLPAWPVVLGRPVRARFRRSVKGGPAGPRLDALGGVVILREEVTFHVEREGEDGRHRKELEVEGAQVLSVPMDATVGAPAPGHVELLLSFTLPLEHPPSFAGRHNELGWSARVTFAGSGVEKNDARFDLLVCAPAQVAAGRERR